MMVPLWEGNPDSCCGEVNSVTPTQTHQGLQVRTVNGELDERAVGYLERDTLG